MKGKFGYLSPEAAYGEPIDPRAQTSLRSGLCCGRCSQAADFFQGQTDLRDLDLVRKARIPELTLFNPDVPPDLETIVYKALARDKSARYQRSDELGNDLMQFPVRSRPQGRQLRHRRACEEGQGWEIHPGLSPAPPRSAFEEMIQQEISHFISATTPEQAAQTTLGATSLEDPAQWFDFASPPPPLPAVDAALGLSTSKPSAPQPKPAPTTTRHPDINLDSAVAAPGMFKDEDAAGDAVDVDFETSESAAPDAQSKQADTQTHTPLPQCLTPKPLPNPCP